MAERDEILHGGMNEVMSELTSLLRTKMIQAMKYTCSICERTDPEELIRQMSLTQYLFVMFLHGLINKDITLCASTVSIVKTNKELGVDFSSVDLELWVRRELVVKTHYAEKALRISSRARKAWLFSVPLGVYRILAGLAGRLLLRPEVREAPCPPSTLSQHRKCPANVEELCSKNVNYIKVMELYRKILADKVLESVRPLSSVTIDTNQPIHNFFALLVSSLSNQDYTLFSLIVNWFALIGIKSDKSLEDSPDEMITSIDFDDGVLTSAIFCYQILERTHLFYVPPQVVRVLCALAQNRGVDVEIGSSGVTRKGQGEVQIESVDLLTPEGPSEGNVIAPGKTREESEISCSPHMETNENIETPMSRSHNESNRLRSRSRSGSRRHYSKYHDLTESTDKGINYGKSYDRRRCSRTMERSRRRTRSPGKSRRDSGSPDRRRKKHPRSPDARKQYSRSPDARKQRSRSPGARKRHSRSPDARKQYSRSPNARKQRSRSPGTRKRHSRSPDARKQYSRSPNVRKQRSRSPGARKRHSRSPDARKQYSRSPDARKQCSRSPGARKRHSRSPDARKQYSRSSDARKRQRHSPDAIKRHSQSKDRISRHRWTPERSRRC